MKRSSILLVLAPLSKGDGGEVAAVVEPEGSRLIDPHSIGQRPKSPPGLAGHDLVQHIDHPSIALHARSRGSIPPRQPHRTAGPYDRQPVLLHEDLYGLPLHSRHYSVLFSTSRIAVFSSARSAYIPLSFA